MDKKNTSVTDFLKGNKKIRDFVILLILFIALIISIIYNTYKPKFEDMKILMCPKCDETFKVFVLEDLSNAACPKCKGKLEKTCKCLTCRYEFPYKPKRLSDSLSVSEKRMQRVEEMICPNCESDNTYIVSVKLYDNYLKEFKEKHKKDKERDNKR